MHWFTIFSVYVGFSILWRSHEKNYSGKDRKMPLVIDNLKNYNIDLKCFFINFRMLWNTRHNRLQNARTGRLQGMRCRSLPNTHGFLRRLKLAPLRLGNSHWIYNFGKSNSWNILSVVKFVSILTWLSSTLDTVCIWRWKLLVQMGVLIKNCSMSIVKLKVENILVAICIFAVSIALEKDNL